MNLEWPKPESSTEIFNDLLLQARTDNTLDENGWPISNAQDRVGFQVWERGLPIEEDSVFDLSFKCKGAKPTLDGAGFVAGTASQDAKTGIWSGKIKIRKGTTHFALGIKNTGGGCTDIHLYREGADRSKTYNPKFINFIKGYDTYRFMEMTATNNSAQTKWSDRNWPNVPVQGRANSNYAAALHTGLAWEHVIEFANETRSNIWINVPILANDDYIRNLARLFKDGLKYNQAIYVEYGNENWNGGMFNHQGKLIEQAKQEIAAGPSNLNPGRSDEYQWGRNLSSRRTREIAIIFSEVFGESAINKQVRILLGGWGHVETYTKGMVEFLESAYPKDPVNKYIYGFATGSYIGDAGNADGTTTFTQHSREEIFAWLNKAITEANSTKNYTVYKALADKYKIKNVIYEGGVDLRGTPRRHALTATEHPLSIVRNEAGTLLAVVPGHLSDKSRDLPAIDTNRACITPVKDKKGNIRFGADGFPYCSDNGSNIVPGTGIVVSASDLTLIKEDERIGTVIKGMLNKWFADTDNSLFVWYKPAVLDGTWTYAESMNDPDAIAQRALRSYTSYTPASTAKPAPRKTLFDFNGDGTADIFWRFTGSVADRSTGNLRLFRTRGMRVVANLPIYQSNDRTKPVFIADQNWQVAATADFNGDGKTDVLWRNNQTGENLLYAMNDNVITSEQVVTAMPIEWKLEGAGDVDGDGKADILWRNSQTGATRLDRMNGATTLSTTTLKTVSADWKMIAIRDVNGDSKADVIWHNPSTGEVKIDLMNGSQVASSTVVGSKSAPWALEAVGDFDGDGKTDIFWRNTNIDKKLDAKAGTMWFWFMDGNKIAREAPLNGDYVEYNSQTHLWANMTCFSNRYRLELAADFDGDGKTDLMWYDFINKGTKIQQMNGNTMTLEYGMSGEYDPAWKIANH